MTLLRPLRWLILATSCLAMLAYTKSEEGSPWGVLLVLLCVAGWVVTEGRMGGMVRPAGGTPRGLPRLLVNITLVCAVPWAIWRAREGDSPVSAFLSLLAVVLALKLWERRNRSDYGQILTMSVFLTIGSTLNDNSFGLGLLLAVQIPLVLLAAMLLHAIVPMLIEQATIEARPLEREAQPRQARPARAQPKRALGSFLVMGVLMLLAGSPVVLGIFIATPRSDMSRLLGSFGVLRKTSGLASSVDLNTGGLISQNREVIARASVRNSSGASLGVQDSPIYLRSLALTEYTSGRWSSQERVFLPMSVEGGVLTPLRDTRTDTRGQIVQRITTLSGTYGPLLAIARPIAITMQEDTSLGYARRSGELVAQQPRSTIIYDVISHPDVRTDNPTRRGETDFPEKGVRSVAGEVLREAGVDPDPRQRPPEEDARAVRVLENFLRSQFEYSLDTPTPATSDVMTWFLTVRPPAHCEFFASALAAMCRSVGIDARVIAGYMSTDYDEGAAEYLVRASDAHAWVEAEIQPGLWATFDGTPTASAGFVATRQAGMFEFLLRLTRRAESFWNATIVSFDARRQGNILGRERQNWLQRLGGSAPDGDEIGAFRARMRTLSTWAMRVAIGAVVVAVGVFVALRLFGLAIPGSRRMVIDAFADDREARSLYRTVLDACAALGVPKPPSVPLWTHVLGSPVLAGAPGLLEASRLLYERAYASASISRVLARDVRAKVRVGLKRKA